MNLFLGVLIGLREIWSHKFRSFLTMLGVILGVASLLSMFSLVAGIAKGMREVLTATGGVERVSISPKDPSEHLQDLAFISPGRTEHDIDALRRGAPLIDLVSGESVLGGAAISRGNVTLRTNVSGSGPEYAEMGRFEIEFGRNISQLDMDRGARVIVIGSSIVSELWPDSPGADPTGKSILVNGSPFVVIGTFPVFESEDQKRKRAAGVNAEQKAREERRGTRRPQRGGGGRGRWDPFYQKNRAAVIPMTTMFQEFKSAQVDPNSKTDAGPNYKLDTLNIRVGDLTRFEEAISQARRVLEGTHRGIDDFGFDTREDWFDGIERSISATRASGGLIASISLLVGGIGITNIMLASISERVREIGVRLAIGAKRRDIFSQFLVESTVIGIIGGLLGLIVSFGLVKVLVLVSPTENAPVVELASVLLSFGAAAGIGVLSGVYPAWRAATLSPIEALRYQ